MPCFSGVQVDKAVKKISMEVEYLKPYFPQTNLSYVYSVCIMNYVVGHVSAPAYGYLNSKGNPTGGDVEDVLNREAGICGAARLVFEDISRSLGVKTRSVFVFYPHPNGTKDIAGHTFSEAFWGGKWHYLDPTWGVFYRKPGNPQDDILSIIEVLELSEEERQEYEVKDETLIWRQVAYKQEDYKGCGMKYLEFDYLRVHINTPNSPKIYSRGGY